MVELSALSLPTCCRVDQARPIPATTARKYASVERGCFVEYIVPKGEARRQGNKKYVKLYM